MPGMEPPEVPNARDVNSIYFPDCRLGLCDSKKDVVLDSLTNSGLNFFQ